MQTSRILLPSQIFALIWFTPYDGGVIEEVHMRIERVVVMARIRGVNDRPLLIINAKESI
jgi:hypothetical protein